MHRAELGHTLRSPKKEERTWEDLQKEKKAYLRRKQEDEDAEYAKRTYKPRCKSGGYHDDLYTGNIDDPSQ